MKEEPFVNAWMVAAGSPFDGGIKMYGPFKTIDDAGEWADNNDYEDHLWDFVPLYPPPEPKGD